jgi:hypothetical protein
MAHLGDRLADFFYEELSSAEMAELRQHIEVCTDCRLRIEQFRGVHLALRTAPALDPPHRIVFSLPERHSWLSWFDWRSAATASVAAALIAGIFIRFSPAPQPAPVFIPAGAPAPSIVVQPEKIEYSRIIDEVRQADRAWLAGQLEKRDQEIQRLRGELAYYETFQRTVLKETFENGSAIQLLAQRTASRD